MGDSGFIAPAANSGQQMDPSGWAGNVTTCGRPSPDLGIPIQCSLVYSNETMRNESQDFDLFSGCCPPVINGSNIWVTRRGCSADCWTYDTGLALNFSKCVNTTATQSNHTRVSIYCEYIDYKHLGDVVRNNTRTSGKGRLKVALGLALAATTVALLAGA
ncbi:hypothetical protein BDV96DRAFT_566157 [Lophiotrema nucula]|uniref:Uncharacterized protein n=1 Tax=Lophiotrema nucula TaxID=690887 RepID=A0A6A5ZKZ3_9PLEO|nr:hypothetical protein BDV96DRAFT_566157 [Lophiotrema nucula]